MFNLELKNWFTNWISELVKKGINLRPTLAFFINYAETLTNVHTFLAISEFKKETR